MSALLMCPPTHYTIAYEINPWMHISRQVRHARAVQQWRALHHLLTTRLRLTVHLMTPQPRVPDLVFTANAGLIVNRLLIRSNFRYPQRQREEPIVERYFRRRRYRVVTLPRQFNFEGEGDALFAGSTLLLGFRFRSDAASHEHLSRLLKCEVLPVELVDKRFYHLDTCFCPLDAHSALWYPRAFDRYGRAVIERTVPTLIAAGKADATRFACNAIASRGALVTQAGISTRLRRRLERHGLDVHETDLSEFLKAGGSAKCLALHLAHQDSP